MIDALTYWFITVAAVAGVMLLYVVIQVYSSNSPYRSDD